MDQLTNASNISNLSGMYSPLDVAFSLILTLVLVALIATVYRTTHKGFSYSQHFVGTLIIISMVTTIIMMVIGNSVAVAFGLLGAFSIIRFRTVVKEVRDTGFIFLSLAIGMAVGTQNHVIAITGTIIMLAVIWVLFKMNFGSIRPNDFLLTFTVDLEKNSPESLGSFFEKYLSNSMLLNMTSRDGHKSEMVYSVRFRKESATTELMRRLSGVPGIERVNIVSAKSDIEY